MDPLDIPTIREIVGFENAPIFSPIFAYSTGELHFPLKRTEFDHFLTKGQKQNVTFDSATLREIAQFSHPPLSELNEHERHYISNWEKEGYKAASMMYAISIGAFSTKNGQVYFWRKINDRVLFIGQEKRGAYLVLPESE